LASYDRVVLKATGERVIPAQQREELVYAEHIARYRFSAQFARGRRVLDAGSGEGYGAALLNAAGAASIVGLDFDKEAISHASQRYGLDFVQGDIGRLPFADGSFDLIVCFETIEHVSDGPRAVAEFRRVLSEDGLLIISTPNRDEYLVENEFHEREYSPTELDGLLGGEFPVRVRLYQQNWLLSAILDEHQFSVDDGNAALDLELSKVSALAPGRELYSIILCGSSVEDLPVQVGAITGVFEAQRLVAQLREWQKRARIAEREQEAWREREKIAQDQREAWEERAREAERQVGETREQVQRAEYALEKLVTSLSWRLTKPLRSARALLSPRR
jgi:SAM-dependent methyltransferase